MTAISPSDLFDSQLATWPDCTARYATLQAAQTRTIHTLGRDYRLIFNPLREKSATAAVSGGNVDRPCFLCPDARPKEQIVIPITIPATANTYHLAVNPYPILSHHFTIIAASHTRQTITPQRLVDMEYLAQKMQGYLLFFNGAQSGASAPDHFHFQAVPTTNIPLLTWPANIVATLFVQTAKADDLKIDCTLSDKLNILCWHNNNTTHWLVTSRHTHRPTQYYTTDNSHILISPAALEYAGIVPLAREADFNSMTPAILADIIDQCYDNEPLIDVGITNEETHIIPNNNDTTTLTNITIGKNFHWEHRRDITYEGTIITRGDNQSDEQWTINRIKAEDYLKSVIASEMAATAGINLLKAHAVISRSWLVRQLARKQAPLATADHTTLQGSEIIRYYDAENHTLFDVCADDHCQRYQGLPPTPNATVIQAIRETRGEVLTYQGEIIDARFSKCCGGQTEEYQYCWDNIFYPYLTSIPDRRADGSILCDTKSADIISQVLNDYDQRTTDFFAWTVTMTAHELSTIVERKGGYHLGTILELVPLQRGPSGRIWRLKIIGTNGEIIVGKELEIRRLLSDSHLYSSNFDVTTATENNTTIFTLHGHGWGHGVGLCQIGAAVMSAEGADYREILAHYYKDTQIMKIW